MNLVLMMRLNGIQIMMITIMKASMETMILVGVVETTSAIEIMPLMID